MAETELDVKRKPVDDLLVASRRFRGSREEVPRRFAWLYEQVEPYVTGKGILLHHYYDQSQEEGHDLEVCYPVREPIEAGEVQSRILPGDEMLYAIHRGPYGPAEAAGALANTVGEMWAHMRKYGIIPGSGPRREVHLEDEQEHGENATRYVTEIQVPYRFHRMDRLAERLERFAGEAVRQTVMADSETYPTQTIQERAAWFQGAMERLDAVVADEAIRSAIMNDCGERFPAHRIETLRAAYQASGDLDEILAIMRADRTLGDLSWYEQPRREGNVVQVSKDPVLPDEYAKATTDVERRAAYCHCGLMRDAIRAGKILSGTYCHCGGGWYRQLWEGILEQPVRVEVLESVLQGDDRCTFAIYLPLHAQTLMV